VARLCAPLAERATTGVQPRTSLSTDTPFKALGATQCAQSDHHRKFSLPLTVPASELVLSVFVFLHVVFLSNTSNPPNKRPLFVPGSAEARVAVKAARFRTAFVQLRASGVLPTAYDSPAFPPRP
jgi:hypothetical protein